MTEKARICRGAEVKLRLIVLRTCTYGVISGGGQNLERPNLERPIFRKFETSNIEITKLELFDFSIFEFILHFYDCLNYSNTQNTYLLFTIKFEIFEF